MKSYAVTISIFLILSTSVVVYNAQSICSSRSLLEKENNTLNATEIATDLGKNYNTIKKYLKILTDLEIVKTEKDKKRLEYQLDREKYNHIKKVVLGGGLWKIQIHSNGIYI